MLSAATLSYRNVRSRLSEVRATPLSLPRLASVGRRPGVYFLMPDYDEPSGGIRVVYRHVDILNQAGIPAAVMHQRPGFRCTWFDNATVVVNARGCALSESDLLVVGELDVGALARASGHRHVIFNQNCFLTWSRNPALTAHYYSQGPKPLAIVTVSEHSADFLRYTFPQTQVARIRLSIEPGLFTPAAVPADQVISFMPRKGAEHWARTVLAMLEQRGDLDGWTVRPLAGLRHEEVARAFQGSAIFLSMAFHEGFGLPAAEAMACGSYVVGGHGYAGTEFLDPSYSSPCDPGDLLEIARSLAEALAQERNANGWLRDRGLAASRAILSSYPPQNEILDVVNTYRSLLEP